MGNKQKGFSLVELLIVVAIILIIAAIAIPNLLRGKMAANEASAAGSLRSINTACISYSITYGQYPPTLAALGPPAAGAQASATNADLLDSVLAAGTKSGYVFTYAPVAAAGSGLNQTYTTTDNPQVQGTTGQRYFFTDQSGVIRADSAQAATAASTPIG
jgi:type IV pilus assembly protein PilA